jgi:hypothetical protein
METGIKSTSNEVNATKNRKITPYFVKNYKKERQIIPKIQGQLQHKN